MIRINLFKPEKKDIIIPPAGVDVPIREKEKEPVLEGPRRQSTPTLVLLLVVVALAAAALTQQRALGREKRLLEMAQNDKRQLTNVLKKLEQLEYQKSVVEKKISLINQLKSQRETAVRIMEAISQNLPDWVWLTELNYDNQILRLKGRAISNTMIADFISKLEKIGMFSAVNLIEITQRTQRNESFLEFTLTATYGTLPAPAAAPADGKRPTGAKRRSP